MNDVETYYRNVDVGDGEEIAVKASKGYGDVIEIVIDGSDLLGDVVIRLSDPQCAFSLGYAIMQAAKTLDPSLDWNGTFFGAPRE